jgi:hypothetical protein
MSTEATELLLPMKDEQASPTVYMAIRTTSGFPPYGEILEVGIMDDEARVLLDSFVKPHWFTEWPGGFQVHGITPEQVADSPQIFELRGHIRDLVSQRNVVTWNLPSDRRSPGMLDLLSPAQDVHCVMSELAKAWYDGKTRRPRWPTFMDAAHRVGYPVPSYRERPAIMDCRAIRAMWKHLLNPLNRRQDETTDMR